jgi:hypothetical protein
MKQMIRELKRQAAGEKLAPEQLKGLIRAGYVYRNGDEHFLTDKGRDALARRANRREHDLLRLVRRAVRRIHESASWSN